MSVQIIYEPLYFMLTILYVHTYLLCETSLSGVKITVRFRLTGNVILTNPRFGGQIPCRANTYHDNKRLTRFQSRCTEVSNLE